VFKSIFRQTDSSFGVPHPRLIMSVPSACRHGNPARLLGKAQCALGISARPARKGADRMSAAVSASGRVGRTTNYVAGWAARPRLGGTPDRDERLRLAGAGLAVVPFHGVPGGWARGDCGAPPVRTVVVRCPGLVSVVAGVGLWLVVGGCGGRGGVAGGRPRPRSPRPDDRRGRGRGWADRGGSVRPG
jgi:hypothetical protein